jgi:hypothetical protein
MIEEHDYEESMLLITASVNKTDKNMVDILDDIEQGETKFGRATSEDYEGISLLKKLS